MRNRTTETAQQGRTQKLKSGGDFEKKNYSFGKILKTMSQKRGGKDLCPPPLCTPMSPPSHACPPHSQPNTHTHTHTTSGHQLPPLPPPPFNFQQRPSHILIHTFTSISSAKPGCFLAKIKVLHIHGSLSGQNGWLGSMCHAVYERITFLRSCSRPSSQAIL